MTLVRTRPLAAVLVGGGLAVAIGFRPHHLPAGRVLLQHERDPDRALAAARLSRLCLPLSLSLPTALAAILLRRLVRQRSG